MKQRNVLMVYPEIPDTYWSFKHAVNFIGKSSLMPPLGLMTVAALLPKEYNLKIIDMNVDPLTEEDIRWAELVFVSAMIVQKESFADVVALCNTYGVPVAAGGPYPTSSHNDIIGVSYFILNEGEVTIPQFILDYEKGRALPLYTSDVKPDITETPVPRFDLIDVTAYGSLSVQYSRGCPFTCEFCDIVNMFGHKVRTKTTAQFIRELEAVMSSGYRGSIFIVDDNFIGNRHNVVRLLAAILSWQKKHDFPFTFYTEASINLGHDDELLNLMEACGFTMVFVGIETPDEETLRSTHKIQNVTNNVFDSVTAIQSRGIEVCAGFILGFDTDPENIFDRQIEFIQRAGIPIAMIGLMMALPGTELYRRLEREGRLTAATSGNNTNDFDLNFVPVMDRQKLVDGYKRVLRELYSPEKYFARSITLLSRMPNKSLPGRRIVATDVLGLFRSLMRQGFSPYGLRYFRYLVQSVKTNPHNLGQAVGLAVKFNHFRLLTQSSLCADGFKNDAESAISLFNQKMDQDSTLDLSLDWRTVFRAERKLLRDVRKIYRHMPLRVRACSHAIQRTMLEKADQASRLWYAKASLGTDAIYKDAQSAGYAGAAVSFKKIYTHE